MKVVAGIDIGKTSLDGSVSAGPVRRFENTPAGLAALVGGLACQGMTEVVCESTGGYERPLVRRVQDRDRPGLQDRLRRRKPFVHQPNLGSGPGTTSVVHWSEPIIEGFMAMIHSLASIILNRP